MTVEQSLLVALSKTAAVSDLIRDIVSAAQRAEKADPGDRTDVVRYEALCVRLEALAARALDDGADHAELPGPLPTAPGYYFDDASLGDDPARLSRRLSEAVAATVARWTSAATVVEIRRPLEAGDSDVAFEPVGAPEPAEPWRAEGVASGSRAVEQRLRSQLEAVTASASAVSRTRGDAINPSGVNNRILTDTLRDFVAEASDERIDAPVTYRDGSRASHPFPLRCLPLAGALPSAEPDLTLHLALLSIRHTEMDPVVDGAWLRNAEVSRPRPAALTDDFVYETSRVQLDHLTDGGRLTVLLHIYQTGLDTAVVGFYRAVVQHLLRHPWSLSVVPMFFAAAASNAGLAREAPFRPGKPWTMGDRP
jgi:hypothetical protein